RFGKIDDQLRINRKATFTSGTADPLPARRRIPQLARTADEGDLAVAERKQMLKRGTSSLRVVNNQRTDAVILEFAPDDRRRDLAFFQVRENVDIKKQPVREDNQTFNAAVEEHLQISLETTALVMNIGQDRQERRLIEGILHAAEHERAIRIGHVRD